MLASREFDYSDRDFGLLQELVLKHTGICLSEHKQDLVYGRLARRLRALRLENFHEYCALINEGHDNEIEHFINAITTNLTAFFRERHHFENLAREVVPILVRKNAAKRRLRIWSAGCSTGEEAYSIAITLHESIPDLDQWDVKILATDLDSNVIGSAIDGFYNAQNITGLSRERKKTWFHKGAGQRQHQVRAIPELRELVSFHQLNLIEEWPMQGPFDVIFCRNVVIYFDKSTQSTLFDRFANYMPPGGRLYIGHSESLRNMSARFRLLGNTIYEKVK